MMHHSGKVEKHLYDAKETVEEAKGTKEMDPEKAHGIFHRLDESLVSAGHAAKVAGSAASHRIAEEIHHARQDLEEWYGKHDHQDTDHHHTFDGLHNRIDAWMEELRKSGREW